MISCDPNLELVEHFAAIARISPLRVRMVDRASKKSSHPARRNNSPNFSDKSGQWKWFAEQTVK
jgi:hypothetical protein